MFCKVSLKIAVNYQINNVALAGDKIYLLEVAGGPANHMKSNAESKLKKIEDTMSVFVNPNDPPQSVIYCKGLGLYVFVFFMAIVPLLIGISNIL